MSDRAPNYIDLIGSAHWDATKMDTMFQFFAVKYSIKYGENIKCSSAYRSKSHSIEQNKISQGKLPGSHSYGKAIDIRWPLSVSRLIDKFKFIDFIISNGFKGIGLYNWGIHIDYGYADKTGKRTWNVSSLRDNIKIFDDKLKKWRWGDKIPKGSTIIDDVGGFNTQQLDEDYDFEDVKFDHPQRNKNLDIEEVSNKTNLFNIPKFDFKNGKMLFGDLFLHVPPISINISSHNQTMNFDTIRTAGNPIISTDNEVVNINMELFFANESSINNELRRIIAMYIRTPFIPIENNFLTSILKKHYEEKNVNIDELKKSVPVALNAMTISTIPGFPNSLQVSLTINELEHRILSNQFKFLVSDNDVKKQNKTFYYYGSKDTSNFNDKIAINTDDKPYKSLPFMKYYQSLLHKSGSTNYLLDPNGLLLKTKDGEVPEVYNTDTTYYHNKYLAEYRNDSNKKYTLSYYEANINLVEERIRNRTKIKTRLDNLAGNVYKLLNDTEQLKWFEYDPKNPQLNSFSNFLTEISDLITSITNFTSLENTFRNITINMDNVGKGLFDEVIKPSLITKWESLENIPTGQKQPLISIKSKKYLNVAGKHLTFLELLSKWNKKYLKSDAKDSKELDSKLKSILEEIFKKLELRLVDEIQDQVLPYTKPLEIILGGDNKTAITNITASFSNKLVPINLDYWTKPAYQHLGSNNWEFTMSVRTTDLLVVSQIREMIEKYRQTAKKVANMRPELIYKNAAYIDFTKNSNSLLNMLGINNAVIVDYSVSTVDNQPGVTDIVLKFVQADLTIDSNEKLNYEGSTPDPIIEKTKNLFKHFVYDEETNQVHLLEFKNPIRISSMLVTEFELDTNTKNIYNPRKKTELTFEHYLTAIYLLKLDKKYKNNTIFDIRSRFEKIKYTITDQFIISIVKEYQENITKIANTLKIGTIEKVFRKIHNLNVSAQKFANDIREKFSFGRDLEENISTPAGSIAKKYREFYDSVLRPILNFFNDSRQYSRILEFIYDEENFIKFLQQINNENLLNDYKEWLTSRFRKLKPNYPDLYLPVFENKFEKVKNAIYTPPDFYFKSYSYINNTFIEEIKDLINNNFDIETNLALLNGQINYKKYESLKKIIEANKEELNKSFGKDLLGNDGEMNKLFTDINSKCLKFYNEKYNSVEETKVINPNQMIAIAQMEEYLYIVLKNLVLQLHQGKKIDDLIQKGDNGDFYKKISNKILNNINLKDEEGNKLESLGDPDKIMSSLQRNVRDLLSLNLLPKPKPDEKNITDEFRALKSYWGLGVKGGNQELNRLERIYNARNFSNLLRIGRAFPTFKIYFIEEDKNEWLFFDDFYSYSSINSIETISNKNAASDTAVIKMSNLANRLMNEKSEDINAETQTGTDRNPITDKNGIHLEQNIESLMLKPGTNIMIKMGYCVDEETEILTKDGWKNHNDVKKGDITLTLNHNSGLSEWQPILEMNNFSVENEEMVSIESTRHSSLTTLAHKWPVLNRDKKDRRWKTSENLRTADILIGAAPLSNLEVNSNFDDDIVEIIAWFWTEGTINNVGPGKRPTIVISQSHLANPDNVKRIRNALERIYGPQTLKFSRGTRWEKNPIPQWRESQRTENGRSETEFRLNVGASANLLSIAPEKIVSINFIHKLNKKQLEIFFKISNMGDGHNTKSDEKSILISQKNPHSLDALEICATLLGYRTHRYKAKYYYYGRGGFKYYPDCLYATKKTNIWTDTSRPTRKLHTGTVWCPTTANHTWMARRKGYSYFTGNSNNPMELETVFQGVITETQPGPIVEIICQSYGNQLNTLIDKEDINWNNLEKEFGDIVTFALSKIPGLAKLGKYSPISMGKSDPLRTPGNLWFRGLQGKFNISSFLSGIDLDNFNTNDPRDDNIYLRYSLDKSFFSKLTFDWRIFNQTVWEVIQEILLYHPDYIAKVLPYNENIIPGNGDIRQTLYVGPKTGAYKYTDKFGYTADTIKDVKWNSIISNTRKKYDKLQEILPTLTKLKDMGGNFVSSENPEISKILLDFSDSFFKLNSLIDSRFYSDNNIPILSNVNSYDFSNPNAISKWYYNNFTTIDMFFEKVNKNSLRSRDSALEYIFNADWKKSPQYKPVRNDHIINSYHHILKNNITVSAEEIFNKVIMTYPKSEPVFAPVAGKDYRTYEVMVDDDINEESIRTYHTFQKNLDVNMFDLLDSSLKLINKKSWIFGGTKTDVWKKGKELLTGKEEDWRKYPTYMRVAMNILAKQMEKMYGGDLVLWGDPTIKTWDVIHLDDIVADIRGSFEVEQVIHRFDAQSGFITVIKPNLITHMQNSDAMTDEAVINEMMNIAFKKGIAVGVGNTIIPFDFPTNLVLGLGPYAGRKLGFSGSKWASNKVGLSKLASKVTIPGVKALSSATALANPMLVMGSLLYGAWKGFSSYSNYIIESVGKLYGRNAIWFGPLIHKGMPYVAGLDGYKEDTYFQHVIQRVQEKNIIQRMGYANRPLDAFLIDGDNATFMTTFKSFWLSGGSTIKPGVGK